MKVLNAKLIDLLSETWFNILSCNALIFFCGCSLGETDWKILCIDVTDPLAEKLNDVSDIEANMPGFLAATVEWFKIYKMPDGKIAKLT